MTLDVILYDIQKLPNGDIKTYKYSSNEYYCHSGKFKADTRRAYWNSEVRDIHVALSGVSPKTINLDRWNFYIHIVHQNLIRLWEHKLPKRWARENLRFYILKNKAMDKWLAKIKIMCCCWR